MRKLGTTTVILLLGIVLSGGHLGLLQGVAWASMLVSRASTQSFAVAVQTTFDGAHPCRLCAAIAEHRDDAQPKPAPDPSAPSATTATKFKIECTFTEPAIDPVPVLIAIIPPTRSPTLRGRLRDEPPIRPPARS